MTDARKLLEPLLGDRLLAPDAEAFAATAALAFPDQRTPALIARPATAVEVGQVLRIAADTGMPLAVRSGGHSYAHLGTTDGGLVLDLRLLDDLRIDPGGRVGFAGGGVTAGVYSAAAAEHGMATGFGDTSTVGISGLALGGGIGHLSRRDGLTIDNVLAAQVALPDGRVLRADAHEHADLFWAVRGGGGNVGVVVTGWELRLTPTDLVTGGFAVFEPRPGTVEALLGAARDAAEELSVMVNVMKAPPVPFLPPELHGTPVVVVVVCHSGHPDDADAVLKPFRSAGRAHADLVRLQPYPALFRAEEPGNHAAVRTGFGDGIDAEQAVDLVRRAPSVAAIVNLRPMGGAIARVAEDATAFAHRRQAVMQVVAAVDPGPAGAERGRAWVAETATALGIGEGPAYVNFLADTGPGALRRAYPGRTLERLAGVRRTYVAGG